MRDSIGVVGWGRFGRALGALLAESGHALCAYDVAGPAGKEVVESLAELTDRSSVVVLAVPIGAMRRSLADLRPYLTADHLVLDVCSVKTLPVEAMTESLGAVVPWVATHPLFGPTSLALGERPLRVVVCPNVLHPAAVVRAHDLYEGVGCDVVEQDPAAHDRSMAETHALAYFVAKGMIDSGFRLDAEYAPPSSQAILRAVEAVRSDAGHLFVALHRDNPFAADVRQRFLDALREVDHTLNEAGLDAGAGDGGSFSIPDLGERSPEIREVRDLIDDLDQEIVSMLARRSWLARRAGRAKAGLGVGVRDAHRESLLLAQRREWAAAAGLDPDAVASLFEEVLRFSRRLQVEDTTGAT